MPFWPVDSPDISESPTDIAVGLVGPRSKNRTIIERQADLAKSRASSVGQEPTGDWAALMVPYLAASGELDGLGYRGFPRRISSVDNR